MADARCTTFFTALNIPFEVNMQAKEKFSLTLDNFSFSSQQHSLSLQGFWNNFYKLTFDLTQLAL